MSESSLHAALKGSYARPGDPLEAPVDGYEIDVLNGGLLIEVQTGNFTQLKPKLEKLLAAGHSLLVVHPIQVRKWIVRQTASGRKIGRRRSPRLGRLEDLFYELVRIPHLLGHPALALEVVFVHTEEVRCNDGAGSWRRKGWSIVDSRLLEITGRRRFQTPTDYLALLPAELAQPFTNRELAEAGHLPPALARKMTYTLRRAGWLHPAGRRGRAQLFSVPT